MEYKPSLASKVTAMKTTVKPSTIAGAGHGLFANVDLAPGAHIVDFGGTCYVFDDDNYIDESRAKASALQKRNKHSVIRLLDYTKEIAIVKDGEGGRDNCGFMANSYPEKENAEFKIEGTDIMLIATKDIQKGQEIFVNYGIHEFGNPIVEGGAMDQSTRDMLDEYIQNANGNGHASGNGNGKKRTNGGPFTTLQPRKSKKSKNGHRVTSIGYCFL